MISTKSIDIIIPSFRIDERYLLPLIYLPKPAGWQFEYIIVVDNPDALISESIANLHDEGTIRLFVNEKNKGAAASRNKGIDAGSGAWILFLDDDIKADENLLNSYTEAIEKTNNQEPELGFIGLTDFNAPSTTFTRALEVGNYNEGFRIALRHDRFMWGVTANILFNRKAMGNLRFSSLFPASGGGEDVDLPLRICLLHKREFKCLKEARVVHPWWNDGKPQYARFVRYGIGRGILIRIHKEFSRYTFPSPVECFVLLLLSFPLFTYFLNWQSWLVMVLAIGIIEYLITFLKMKPTGPDKFAINFYMVALRICDEWGKIMTDPFHTFMKFTNIGSRHPQKAFHLNKWKISKLILFAGLFGYLVFRHFA